ncbi:MAG: hypothetical protein ACT4TC_07540 [Myxococcaceae bacterium]
MDSLGGYLTQTPSTQPLRIAVFLGVLLLTAVLERLQSELRADERSTWWVSNGRDVLNVFAAGACGLGLWVLGFRGPLILCLAITLTVVLSLIQAGVVDRKWPPPVSLAVALMVGSPVALAPGWFAKILHSLLVMLFA